MFLNLALQDDPSRFVAYRSRFEEFCAHADECQRLADRQPAVRQQYEDLAHQWRDLSRRGIA